MIYLKKLLLGSILLPFRKTLKVTELLFEADEFGVLAHDLCFYISALN